MLIESSELMKKVGKNEIRFKRRGKSYFSQYKAAIDCIQKMEDIIADIEAETSAKNSEDKYADNFKVVI